MTRGNCQAKTGTDGGFQLNSKETITQLLHGCQVLGNAVGGGLQMQTDLAISPAGDLGDEQLSRRGCGGQGVVIFFSMAKPVRSPQIGPARPLGER